MKFSSLLKTSGLIVAALAFVQCSSSTKATGGTTPDSGTTPGCQAYCDAITANCKGDVAAGTTNAQYGSMDTCLASCSAFPTGSAQTGNTLACRTTHANNAAGSPANALLHCPHAGPGGDVVCGDVCDGYCQIVDKFCIGTHQVYSNHADCLATCRATPAVGHFTIADSIQATNEQSCLLYHAQEGSFDPSHCTDDLAKQTGDAGVGGSVTCH